MTKDGLPLEFAETMEDVAVESIPEFSDDALSDALSAKHKDELRYVAKWSRWMSWSGTRWQHEEFPDVCTRARAICRETALRVIDSEATQRRLASAKTVAAVEWLARGDPRHRATVEQWDAEPMLLNTPGGIVDLRTGELLHHERERYLTKQTGATPGGSCSLWLKFLDRVTDGNLELQSFLQRMCGYFLTGSTKEQALFFAWGPGGNGKGVFEHTVSRILGDYKKTAPASVVTASKNDAHPTDMAGLQGARLAVAPETENGRQWAEAKIKALTGEDEVTCRKMHQDFWEYKPTFKLLVVSNHKPTISSVDQAIRRRINLIPFTVQIKEAERDRGLQDKLRPEDGGILQWMIAGCLEWQRIGLCPPAAVQDATQEYLAAEDVVGRWLEERCVQDRRASTGSSALYHDYIAWCDNTRESPITHKKFSQDMQDNRKFRKERSGRTGVMFHGIGLKADVGCE